jgi:glutathione synthase/RimK-type ligase-like ATP-grasp enzyme
MPDFDAISVLQSKLQFHALANELRLPQPEAQVLTDQREIDNWHDYPRYAKLDFGTAGQAVRLVHNRQELIEAIDEFREHGWWSSGMPILMQRPATGEQGFVRAIFNRGELLAHHATVLRRRGVGGAAVAKVGVQHPVVAQHMRRLGERLQWHGALFCDYFYDEATQAPQYIEANPRIGDSANAAFSGLNL